MLSFSIEEDRRKVIFLKADGRLRVILEIGSIDGFPFSFRVLLRGAPVKDVQDMIHSFFVEVEGLQDQRVDRMILSRTH